MINLNIPYVRYKKIKKFAAEFDKKYNSEKNIPVPIEFIIEAHLDIRIHLHPHLGDLLENESFITKDFTTIWINENLIISRYRFSLAHEIGHYWMHRNIYGKLPDYNGSDEYKNVYNNINQEDIERLEIQANNFAGALLIPDYHFEDMFKKSLKQISGLIEASQKAGLTREDYTQHVTDKIAEDLAKIYDVSMDTVKFRILNDTKYITQIP